MVFLGVVLRYFVLVFPVFLLYLLTLRKTGANPKFLSLAWTAANLGIVAYLVYWGITGGGLSPGRALAYTIAAVVVVLVPTVAIMTLILGRDSPGEPSPPQEE